MIRRRNRASRSFLADGPMSVAGPSRLEIDNRPDTIGRDGSRRPISEPFRGLLQRIYAGSGLPFCLPPKKLLAGAEPTSRTDACPLSREPASRVPARGCPAHDDRVDEADRSRDQRHRREARSPHGGRAFALPSKASHQSDRRTGSLVPNPGALRISTSVRPPSRTGLAAARSVRRGSPSPASSRGSRRRCSRSRPGSRSAC